MNLSKTRTWNSATVAQGSYFDDEYDQIYANFDEVKGLFTHTDATVQTLYIDNADNLGIGETAPVSAVELTNASPYITTHNSTSEDTDGGRESRWIARGQQSGAEETILGYCEFAHSGTGDDENGLFRIYTNDGSDGTTPTLRMTIDESGYAGIGVVPLYPLSVDKPGVAVSAGTSMISGIRDSVSGKGLYLGYSDTEQMSVIHSDGASSGIAFLTHNGSWAERMRIHTNGYVGINTTAPERFLHIQDVSSTVSGHQIVLESRYGAYGAGISFQSRTSAAGTRVEMARITADGEAAWNTTASTQDAGMLFFTTVDGVSAEKARITSGGLFRIQGLTASLDVQTDGSKNLTSVSDKNWKNDKGLIENGVNILNKLKPRYFTWKRDSEGNTIKTVDKNPDKLKRIDYKKQFEKQPTLAGFFSQEVFAAFPEGAPGGANKDTDGVEHWGLNSRAILALSTKAIQELDARLKLLEAK